MNTTDIQTLREEHYNASVVNVRMIHEDLAFFTVRPDGPALQWIPGQYTTLGLGSWESRLRDCQLEPADTYPHPKLIRRAYSISSPLLDSQRQLIRAHKQRDLEFYIALVRRADHPPALTPRLFQLQAGDRLALGEHCHGHYNLEAVQADHHILFVATGTGEAPHNAMLGELLHRGHTGRITSVVCARYLRDLAYASIHHELESRFANYRYMTLTTREPFNVDASRADFVGKQYVQDLLASGKLEQACGHPLHPETTRVFLCGNPSMIGVPSRTHDLAQRYPKPTGMIELLEGKGFRIDLPHEPGNIFFEKYW